MALESYHIYTATCDIPGCREKKTSGDVESLREQGWDSIEIFSQTFEVCPEHKTDIQDFFLHAPEV